ncbi:integrator complex subunit 5 isoform X1 [Ostrinia furnacalis]|uniref:integrator complex subunit 5 isoform X1 n=1 Tax=Ostrinia furnacalis TaxID=93504 RepID=UPI00103D1323|nr:integrator complex subunit 5 isoform X1 [Ostrinia furnacalis]
MNPQTNSTALSADLNSFIYGVSRRNSQNAPELTKIGISLLKNFPAARDAVLEFFAMVFHDAVNVSLNQSDYEPDLSTNGSLESVSMIGPELCSLGPSWAPFITPWCINLIMDIATKKSNVPNATLQSLETVRTLLDMTTQNLTLLNSEERAKCIDMMLGSWACSWAVGWVGRAEPALVAPRALALGVDAARAVLAHLAQHPPALLHVRAALADLFHEAIKEDSKIDKKRDVIPYLLNLASKSDIVLKALTQDIALTLTDEVMDRLCVICSTQRHTPAWEGVGPASLVALLMRCDVRCLLLLLKYAQKNLFCRQLLEYLLQKLEFESLFPDKPIPLLTSAAEEINIVREKLLIGNKLEQYSLARILILVSYNQPSEFISTVSYLLQYARDDSTLALLVRIISGTITMHVPNDGSDVIMDSDRYQGFIKTAVEHALRDAVLADTEIKRCFIEDNVPKDQKTYVHYYCLNIIKLLRWENSNQVSHLRTRPIGRAVEANLYGIGGALKEYTSLLRPRPPCTMASLDEMPTCHALAEVLDRVDMSGTKSPPPSVEVLIKVVQSTVKYFFRCLHEKDIMDKLRGVQTACRLLRKLCIHSKMARSVALRDLLETAMFREEKAFGSRPVVANTVAASKDWPQDDLLINLNQKHGPITQLTQSHTSVFHAGIIGKGVRKLDEIEDYLPPVLTANNELLMGALMSCMDGNSGIVEGMTSVSLLLVELVAPDVMYNGLPWPDEDFTKQVSIERELYMRCALEACVVARSALRRCAGARPSLCLASSLLRAVAATLLHRLKALLDRHTHAAEISRERAALCDLLTTMTLGQLLPHPLSHMLEMAPELTANEIVQVIRDCLWNYTRDNVPSPALFPCDSTGLHWRDPVSCKPSTTYTDTLRLILQKRIGRLGHLYPTMFLNLEKDAQ